MMEADKLNESNIFEESRTWVFQITFLVNKDLESGLVESATKLLNPSVRILEFAKKEVINQNNSQ